MRSEDDTQPATDETLPAPDSDRPTGQVATGEWAAGARVAHYVVLARIGSGGMGSVYRAEDVDLGRPVALKRLHVDASEAARARLVREARAAAALQHPNVVTVHEVGEHGGTPFLAMELVDGVTLTGWLRERTRSWREVAGVVAQAGRGLAAAHARGLVHRDFKPDNVLIDRSGRVRVADFGLARTGDAPPEAAVTPAERRLARLTATGSLAGTPAYMAPEIVEGGAPDARSDQYAFAVALYEALHGQLPFEGTTPAAMWAEMAAAKIRANRRRIPAWLDRAVRRGLAVDPAKRWPDVARFVAELERPRRRGLWIGGAAVVAAAAAAIAFVATRPHGASCDQLATEARPPATHEDLARAVKDPAQLAVALAAVDRFTTDYRTSLRESCRATQAGTQSAALGDKRTACLELARRRAFFVVDGIVSGSGHATQLDDLPDATACNDPEWLARAAPLPVAQADRDALYAAEQDLANAGRQRDDGKLPEAGRLATGVHATAMRLGDRELAARAALLLGELDRDRGDMRQAELDAMDAWSAASAGGDTDLTLRAQVAMLGAAASHDRGAIGGFAGLGKDVPDSVEGARLVSAYGDALAEAGKFADAEAQFRRAQEIRERVLPKDHVERALGLQKIGAILAIEKRSAEAIPLFDVSQPLIEGAFPPLRREAIEGLHYRAMAEEDLGHHERVLELEREVLARRAKVLGPDAALALDARADVARALGDLGHDAEAAAELEQVIAGHLARDGERSGNAANARLELANRLVTLGRYDEADAALAKALPVIAAMHGEDSPYVYAVQYAQVRSLVERPHPVDLERAAAMLDRIEPVFAKLFGASSQPVASCRLERARILIAQRDPARAEAQAASAIAMLGDANLSDRAELELVRAKALGLTGRRDDAHSASEAAARDYDAAGAGFADRAKAARDWAAGASVPP